METSDYIRKTIDSLLSLDSSLIYINPVAVDGRYTGKYVMAISPALSTDTLRERIIRSLIALTNRSIAKSQVIVSELTADGYTVSITNNDCKVGYLDHDPVELLSQFRCVLSYAGYSKHRVIDVRVFDLRGYSGNTEAYIFTVRYR